MISRMVRTTLATLILVSLMTSGFWRAIAQESAGSRTTPSKAIVQTQSFGPSSPDEYKAGEVLVKFRDDISIASAAAIPEQYNAISVRSLQDSSAELWLVPEGRELATVKQLHADPRVEYAEPNYLYFTAIVPDDPRLIDQWPHTLIKSPAAWDITTGSPGLTIAIIDTGIDFGHPDLADKIVPGQNFVDAGDPWDENGHGTHVAGIAAAVTNNGSGVAGMNWQARIMPVQVLDFEGRGYASDVADGVYWAYQNGAKVLNLSLVGSYNSQYLKEAVGAARAAGALVIAAMGNCRIYDPVVCPTVNPTNYPAAYDAVMAVAATTRADGYAYYSQHGDHCDISAPGGETPYIAADGILSTLPTYDDFYMRTAYGYKKDYDYSQGTSMATPYVAGLAALIWTLNPTLTPGEVQAVIEATADDLGARGWDPNFGYGRINALAALQAVIPPAAPTLFSIDNDDGGSIYLVDWGDVPHATSYTLEEDRHPGFPSPTERYQGADSQFMVTGQEADTWYYRVRASNYTGNSPWSNIRSTSVKPEAPVLTPISNSSNEDEYEVIWLASVGASGYELQEADNPSFNNPKTRYTGMALYYYVTGQPGGTWHYRVRAHNMGGDSAWSNKQSTTVEEPALAPPQLSAIDNGDGNGNYVVNWTDVSGATAYKVEESLSPFFDDPKEVYFGAVSQYTVANHRGGTWHYRVRAIGPSGDSPWSNQQSATVTVWFYLPLLMRDDSPDGPGSGIPNGDFESGRIGWTESSLNGLGLIMDGGFPTPVAPRGGSWAAWLGGKADESAHIQQQVTLPIDRAYLAYWHWIQSGDLCGYDLARVTIDGSIADRYDLCDSENTEGWTRHIVDLSGYAGQSVSLRIEVETDATLNSSLFIDDVSFQPDPFHGPDSP